MGHPAHFLQRLDRLSRVHTEEALLLYNDTPLLRSILEMARLPEQLERVAIALGEDGPYVVITRDGRFITCLGEGMVVHGTPVISRTQLDTFARTHLGLRARLGQAEAATDERHGLTDAMLARLRDHGPQLTRELFLELTPWVPTMDFALLSLYFEAVERLADTRDALERTGRGDRHRQIERGLRDYWTTYWSAGNIPLLLSTHGSTVLHRVAPDIASEMQRQYSWGLIRQGTIGHAIRGAICTARLGADIVDDYAFNYRRAETPNQVFASALPLIALAFRHPTLNRYIEEVFNDGRKVGDRLETAAARGAIEEGFAIAQVHPEQLEQNARIGGKMILETLAAERKEAPPPPELLDDLDLVRAALVTSTLAVHCTDFARVTTPQLVAWMAQLPVEELLVPERLARYIGAGPWRREQTQRLIDILPKQRVKQPVRVEKQPGRNDPCACGSGKKHKKCCG